MNRDFSRTSFLLLRKMVVSEILYILDLKEPNEHITYRHFKMESITNVAQLIHLNCCFMTIHIKDVYLSVYVNRKRENGYSLSGEINFFDTNDFLMV